MEWLRHWFATNSVVVFAVYGQVFFILGVAIAVQSMKHTRLDVGRHLRWLAAFGLSHGLVEWGYVFIPIQATYLSPRAVELLEWLQLALLVASFLFLLQFGVRSALRRGRLAEPRWSWLLAGVLLVAALLLGVQPDPDPPQVGFEVWVRYLVAVPAAAAGAVGVIAAARDVRAMGLPRIARWLEVAAYSLGGYAVLNLFTPEHHQFLARWMNYPVVEAQLGVPVQVLRTMVGGGMLVGMVRGLSVFQVETDRLLMAAQEEKRLQAQRELAIMNQVAVTLGQAQEPQTVMGPVLEQLASLLGCTGGELGVRVAGREDWRLVARSGWSREPGEGGWRPAPLAVEAAAAGRVVTGGPAEEGFGVGIPVRGGRGVLGAAVLCRATPLTLTREEQQLLASLGNLVGVALENGRLWAEVRRREAARTEWITRIILAQEDERRRIAHELHDEAIQALVLLCRSLDAVPAACGEPVPETARTRLDEARRQAEEIIAVLRAFTGNLRPPALDDLGLVPSVRRLVADTAARLGIAWDVGLEGIPRRLGREVEVGLYRIVQEAVRNVERHSGAGFIRVEFQFLDGETGVRVMDDGRGFDFASVEHRLAEAGKFGLLGMRERAGLLGGTLRVESRPGAGTAVSVTIPADGSSG